MSVIRREAPEPVERTSFSVLPEAEGGRIKVDMWGSRPASASHDAGRRAGATP
jgi:hypothetical protein